jgi:hypothetical protein
MASPTATDKIRSNYLFQVWDHDPAVATALAVSPDGGTTVRSVDMRDYSDFAVVAVTTVMGGAGINLLEIIASDSSDLSTNISVIKTSGVLVADALCDWAIQSCTAAEVAQEGADAGYDLRYVGGRLTCDNVGDEAVVIYFALPNRPHLDLTAASTIS